MEHAGDRWNPARFWCLCPASRRFQAAQLGKPTVRAATGAANTSPHSTLSTAEQRTFRAPAWQAQDCHRDQHRRDHHHRRRRVRRGHRQVQGERVRSEHAHAAPSSGGCPSHEAAEGRRRVRPAGRVHTNRCTTRFRRAHHAEISACPWRASASRFSSRECPAASSALGKALSPRGGLDQSRLKPCDESARFDDKENLTSLGEHLASLPVDVRVGKMLLYGAVLGAWPVLTIAAVLGGRSPFVAPLDKRDDADAAKRMFAEDQSDHLTNLNAFNAWLDARALGKGAEMAFTRDNFLSFRTLEGIADLRAQFAQLLHEAGFLGNDGKSRNRGRGRGAGGRGARESENHTRARGAAGSDSSRPPAAFSRRRPSRRLESGSTRGAGVDAGLLLRMTRFGSTRIAIRTTPGSSRRSSSPGCIRTSSRLGYHTSPRRRPGSTTCRTRERRRVCRCTRARSTTAPRNSRRDGSCITSASKPRGCTSETAPR